jgi:hypothetical protein
VLLSAYLKHGKINNFYVFSLTTERYFLYKIINIFSQRRYTMTYQDKIQQLEKQLQNIREKISIRESRENEDVYDSSDTDLDRHSKIGKSVAKKIYGKLQEADDDTGIDEENCQKLSKNEGKALKVFLESMLETFEKERVFGS